MRIAWFRPAATDDIDPLDDTAALIDELRAAHDIAVVTARDAHDFVWQQHLRPWDLCVYELDNTRAHQFIWAYMLNYPGVLRLRSTELAHLRVPLLASRVVVATNEGSAELLRRMHPDIHVRVAPTGIAAIPPRRDTNGAVSFAVFDRRTRGGDVVGRAMQRARDAGATFLEVRRDAEAHMLTRCDVVIAPGWPPSHQAPTAVLAGMAAGKAVVTMETDATAEWPAVDPQTWRPRGLGVTDQPIAVTIDPRDEEHSLMLAIRRLSSDAASRAQLGASAYAWWQSHATPAHAAAAWMPILEEAVRLSPPPRPDDWPPQFSADGTELTRNILSEFGLPTDTLARW
jgi:hypothetical protein